MHGRLMLPMFAGTKDCMGHFVAWSSRTYGNWGKPKSVLWKLSRMPLSASRKPGSAITTCRPRPTSLPRSWKRSRHSTAELIKTLGGYGAALGGGLAAGALGAIGAYGLVGTLGAASTGTAIGTLSGAAATNAALAWFGGGSLAVGGAGIAGGTAVTGRYRSRSRSNRNGSIHGDKSRKGRKGDRTENQANQS